MIPIIFIINTDPLNLQHKPKKVMNRIKKHVEHLLSSKCPLSTISEHLSEVKVSVENRAELEDIVSMLEIHENDIRSLRQSLSLRIRQYKLEYYSEYFRKNITDY